MNRHRTSFNSKSIKMLRQLFTTYNLVFNKRSGTDWVIEEYQISLPDSEELEWELILPDL